MLNFLGMTRHLSTTAGYAKRIGWLLFEDVTQSPFPVTGVSFTGVVKTEQGDLPIAIEHGEQEHCLALTIPALPVGRWPYAVHAQDESGEDLRLFSGYIGAVDSVAPIESSTVYDIPVMGITIPIEASKTIKAQWLSNTASIIAAQQAQQNANTSSTNVETASQAAKTATDAAATAAGRAEEAEGYAGSAYASKRAAADSASVAGTSAANAARDAKSANDAKTDVESLAATWPETVSNGEQAVNTAKNDALDALQDKQADAVLAVGRAQKTATDKIAGAQTAAVAAVQTAQESAVGTITPLVQRAETAREDIDQAERRINTAADNAATSATAAANSATAAQQALEAIPQVDASGNMTLAGGLTAAGAVNANGGINIPLTVGAATDTSAVNRLYAAGLAAVTDAFSVRCYPLLADCSSSNGTVFKTDREPNSLYFNVPPNSAFTVKCGLVTNARPMHNYSSIRGWVAPLRLPSVSTKFTARFGQMTTVARMGRDRDAFTLVPDQAAGGYRIGEIIDITFDHVRDADAGGYHIRVREIYYSNAEQKWKMKTTQALAPETSSNTGYPVCVYAVVYEQYQDGGYDTEDRGALWLLHGGNSSRGCVKIATVKGVHCFESIYPFSGYYLDMENTNSWALAGAFLPATMHLHCNNVNPAYYGFSSMESNIIVSEAVEDFVDPEAETTTED